MAAPTFSSFPSLPTASTSSISEKKQRKDQRSRNHSPGSKELRDRHNEKDRKDRRQNRREKEHSDTHSRKDRDDRPHSRKDREERRNRHREEARDLVISKESTRPRQLSPERKAADFATWYDNEPIPAIFTDVVIDRTRFNADYTLDPPSYRRRNPTVIGLPSLFRMEYSKEKDQRGIEISYKDMQSGSTRTRLPLQPPPAKIRRLPIGVNDVVEFDSSIPFVHFGIRPAPQRPMLEEEISDDEFELEFADLPASDAERRGRVQALERQLRDDPGDTEAWLRYATQHLDHVTGDPLDGPFDKSQAEISLSILDKAINANTCSSALHLAYIRVAQQISSPDDIGKRWRTTLIAFPITPNELDEVLPVWMAYLGWCQTEGFGTFRDECVAGVLNVYQDLIGRLRMMLLQTSRNTHSSSQLEAACLYLVLRVALFLKHTGYTERGFGLFQAMIEITFFKPTDLIAPMTDLVPWWHDLVYRAEKFWTSESPRFGEAGSAGWKAGKRSMSPVISSKANEPASSFEDWYERETTAERSTTAQRLLESEDDPHAIVLLDDIKPFLTPVLSAEMRLQTVYALLTFLGVTFVPPDTPTTSPQAKDPFLHWSVNTQSVWPRRSCGQAYPWRQEDGGQSAILPDNACRYWAFDVDTLFPRPEEWFSYARAHTAITDLPLISRCMAQLQPLIPDPRFGMMMLALEGSSSMRSAASRAKSMLSDNRDNLNLWNAYASLEIGRHRYESARSVFANALSFARSQSENSGITDEDELDLLAGWVQMESDIGQQARAIDLLVLAMKVGLQDFIERASGNFIPPQPSAMQLLKLGQHYETKTTASSAHIRLRFFYLTLVQEDIRRACSTCLQTATADDNTETMYQFLLRQLWSNQSKAAQREMRNMAENAVALFPHNTIFQQMNTQTVRKRSQRAAEQAIEAMLSIPDISIMQLLWGIGAMARLAGDALWKADGSGAARLRGLLSKAANTSLGRQSSAIWQIYIDFEGMMGNSATKQLCYRAVSNIGSVKALYMLPFSPNIRKHFSPREHREWLLLMVERGIRTRVPFEELLEVEEVDQLIHLPSDEELEDDELAFLQEAQNLKPYV